MRIEIIGNIASGKSTLAHLLSDSILGIFENSEKNPFLKSFYQAPGLYSLETEITFTLQHYHEIKKKLDVDTICDFSLLLDLAYADVTLSADRRRIYSKIYSELEAELGHPEFLIYLRCPEEVLMERIVERGREFEKNISIEYLGALRKSIEMNVKQVPSQTEIIEIDSRALDFAHDASSILKVRELILESSR